jgi:hypothetical protein
MPIGSHRSEAIQNHSQMFQHAATLLRYFDFHYVIRPGHARCHTIHPINNIFRNLHAPLPTSEILASIFGNWMALHFLDGFALPLPSDHRPRPRFWKTHRIAVCMA